MTMGREAESVRSSAASLNGVLSGNSLGNARSPQSSLARGSEKNSRIWDAEKHEDGDENEGWPIDYRYLTFETNLDLQPTTSQSSANVIPALESSDLNQFQSPFNWPQSRKRWILFLSCLTTVFTAFTAGAYAPGAEQMTKEWTVGTVPILCGITTFTTGFGIAPMFLAPLSEINGRRPVFIATGLLFVLCQLCCALTHSYAGMLLARFFVGVGGSTFSTMVGGVVSDIYHTKDRNTPMALFAGAALFGTGLGPLVAGFIAQNLNWRWMFYLQTIIDGTLMIFIIVFFKETRGSVLLSRKAKFLNKWYEEREATGCFGVPILLDGVSGQCESRRIRWKVKSDEERASLLKMIGISLYRPFHLLCTEPVVFFFSLWISFSWAVLYLTLAAVPLVFGTIYDFSVQQSGAVFAAVSIAAIVFTGICILQERIAKERKKLPDGPEARLYFACYESALLPVGLFMFGWTLSTSIHWIVPTIALAMATVGIFSIYLAVFNYLADTYHRYASSALAAQSFCRNILGGVFPLITDQMYTSLGYGEASSLLGGLALLLTLVPWALMLYGPTIRARSKFASEIMDL